jgi:hypothetical protein
MKNYMNDKAVFDKAKVKKTLIRFTKHKIVIEGKVKIFITASDHSGPVQFSKMKLKQDEEDARLSLIVFDMQKQIGQ